MSYGEEQRKEIETIKKRQIKLELSDADCDRLARKCGEYGLTIGELIENFVGDLVDGTYSNGSDERMYAQQWFDFDIYLENRTFSQQKTPDYIDLNKVLFQSKEFFKMKAHEKYMLLDLMRSTALNRGMRVISVKEFYHKYCNILQVSKRMIQVYLQTLRKYFSVHIKDGKYYIKFLGGKLFQKPTKSIKGKRATYVCVNTAADQQREWHDVMSDALTFNKNSVKIEISGTVDGKAKTYTLSNTEFAVKEKPGNGDTFMIAVADLKAIVDREFDAVDNRKENTYGQTVTVTYNATLNDKAAENTGRPGFENDVRLEFSNDADSEGEGKTGYTPWDTVVCFTYRLNPIKTNDHDKVLDGAKFRLYSDADCKNEVYVKEGQDGYIVINRDSIGGTDHTGGTKPDTAVEMVSNANGTFNIYGLDSGTYYLKETDAPDGYRLLTDPIKLELKATFTTERDSYVKGDGATDKTLTAFDAKANIKTFYNGISKSEDKTLETSVEDGSANITIVNQVGKKLPITGTSTVVIMLGAGVVLMSVAIAKGRKKDEEI